MGILVYDIGFANDLQLQLNSILQAMSNYPFGGDLYVVGLIAVVKFK